MVQDLYPPNRPVSASRRSTRVGDVSEVQARYKCWSEERSREQGSGYHRDGLTITPIDQESRYTSQRGSGYRSQGLTITPIDKEVQYSQRGSEGRTNRSIGRMQHSHQSVTQEETAGPGSWCSTLTISQVLAVYVQFSLEAELHLSEFEGVLRQLLEISNQTESLELAEQLSRGLDHNESGMLTSKELFIRVALLCSDSIETKLDAIFQMIDAEGSGGIYIEELRLFLLAVAPHDTPSTAIQSLMTRFVSDAAAEVTGFIEYTSVIVN